MNQQTPRSGTLQSLAPVLAQAMHQAGLGRVVLLSQLIRRWPDIAGTPLAAVTQPEWLSGQMLFVSVTDAIWRQELMFSSQAKWLENIRRVLGDVPISKLHFTLATSSQSFAPDPVALPEPRPLPLTAEEECQLLEDTGHIADTELREVVRRAWRRGWEARRQGA